MKTTIYTVLLALITVGFASCEKRDYPAGTPEFENYYYAGYLPWNNTGTESVLRTQTKLVKFPVQFNSAYVRDYDASAYYKLVTTGITNPAVLGQDFDVVDKNGNSIKATDGNYALVFPKAQAKIDTIYLKVLNSSVAGTRKIEIDLVKNVSSNYTVGTFSQSYIRFLEVK